MLFWRPVIWRYECWVNPAARLVARSCINCSSFLSVKIRLGKPSKLAQVVGRVTSIRELLGSNLGRDTDYSDRVSWLSSVPPGKYRDSTLNYTGTVR
jgi:hypothetical protein